ncbi:hypothetical protein [Streptomyces xanthophaeus]|uniref:hypothetical protein n=1 Tax=Streptomyces xanthophaeus TaxID=67385 RepID=UPI00371C58EE
MKTQHPAKKNGVGKVGPFERLAEHAIQRKLDAIAGALLEQMEGTGELGPAQKDLKQAIRMEERQ